MNIFYERDENTDNVEYTSIDSLLNNDNEFCSIMDTSSIHLITNNMHDDTPLASTSENSTSYQSVDNDQLKNLLIDWNLDCLYQICIGNNTKPNIKMFYYFIKINYFF